MVDEKMMAVLKPDKSKETDLYNYLDTLRSSRRLSDFALACIRTCWEHPEYLKENGYQYDTLGMTSARIAFYSDIDRKIKEIRGKVDKMYDIVFKAYSLALAGKRLGLEGKVESSLRAQFLIQRQIDEIVSTLGVSNLDYIWVTNKVDDISKRADEVLEYIIESYDGVVKELVSSSKSVVCVDGEKRSRSNESDKSVEEIIDSKDTNISNDNNGVNKDKVEVEPVSFENADWGSLDAFIGGD